MESPLSVRSATRQDRSAARRPVSSAPAVDRALDILERLGRASGGVTLSELSEELRLPKNAVFRITQSLLARGYVEREERTRGFRLTPKLLGVALPRRGDISLVGAALEPMRSLRDRLRETVQLGLEIGDEGVIIEKFEGLHPLRIAVDVGLRFKLHNNAPGKVLLAFQSPAGREALVGSLELTSHTARTITDRRELRKECARVVENGYATDHGEADDGIHCVAAPVFGPREQLAAVVWISAPARRLPRDSFAAIGQQVIRTAADISRGLHVETGA